MSSSSSSPRDVASPVDVEKNLRNVKIASGSETGTSELSVKDNVSSSESSTSAVKLVAKGGKPVQRRGNGNRDSEKVEQKRRERTIKSMSEDSSPPPSDVGDDQDDSLQSASPTLQNKTLSESKAKADHGKKVKVATEMEKTSTAKTDVTEKSDASSSLSKQQHKRSFEEEMEYVLRETPFRWRIRKGFVPNMIVDGVFFVNKHLEELTFEELATSTRPEGNPGGFVPALKQIANVAALPGIVTYSIGLPDVHSGYGFAIGNVAAFDMNDPEAVVSPGGVGFDINCGVRLIRTNLTEAEVSPVREELAQALFDHIPVGVGAHGIIPMTSKEIDDAIEQGVDWCVKKGYAWPEDGRHCEEQGRMPNADPSKVSERAKKRGLPQLGTLGAGNHYGEVQVVEEIFDAQAAEAMGIKSVGQVVLMIHCGSRGLGHQVATDALINMEKVMKAQGVAVNDRQLACARIDSPEGQNYLASMAAAANYAWVNRSSITYTAREAFSKVFKKSPRDLDMHVVYDVSHNIAKIEDHIVNGEPKKLLVHRKGSTRAFPPGDDRIPEDYKEIGQPILIGGTMGTCSYVLTGTEEGMRTTFGSTCHGAGRVLSRARSRRELDSDAILRRLQEKKIAIRVASPKLVMEEAPESYKNVDEVIETCHAAGISKKTLKLRPIAVIKG